VDAGTPRGPGDENQNPCFEYLGDEQRCSGAEAHAQGPNMVRVSAANLQECQAACQSRADCVAVADYFNTPIYPVCYYQTGACGTAFASGIWEEEDAGKEYLKMCSDGECRLEYLGNWVRCTAERGAVTYVQGGFDECQAACLADDQCTTLTDFHYLSEVPGCYLYTANCEFSAALPFGDGGKYYRKFCSPAEPAFDAGIDGGTPQ
jgi:hypothetical protein